MRRDEYVAYLRQGVGIQNNPVSLYSAIPYSYLLFGLYTVHPSVSASTPNSLTLLI